MPTAIITKPLPSQVPFDAIAPGVAFIDNDDDVCFKVPYANDRRVPLVVYISPEKGICAVPDSWYDENEGEAFQLYTGIVTLTW